MKNKRNWGKEIKDVGVLIIIVGIVMLGIIFFAFNTSNTQSILYIIANRHFIFLIIGGLVCVLAGIIVRSIGKSKEIKFNEQQSDENK